MRPFISYFGGKFRAAPRYPQPRYKRIVEPFAGAAGYSLRYFYHDVILVENYLVLVEMWDFLIHATEQDILSIPFVEHVDELPSRVPKGARHLVGFAMNSATTTPRKQLSAGRKK